MSTPSDLDAVRAAYDAVATGYAAVHRTTLASKPFDRAMLSAFADLVMEGPLGRVADVGCGPGHVTAFLRDRGLDVFGVDLSPQMVVTAGNEHPALPFHLGSLRALALGNGSLRGITAWYSIIHTPPAELPSTFTEFSRVLDERGYAMMAFQVGHERVRIDEGYGHTIALDAYRFDPDTVSEQLASAGLVVQARLVRRADTFEKTPQAYLLAQKT